MREPTELEPAAMLPAQFFRRPGWQAEKRLMLAVLEHALATVHRRRARGTRRARAVADAEDWFASRDTGWPFAFESICDALDLDAGAIRGRLARAPGQEPPGRFPFRRECARPVTIRLRRRGPRPPVEDATARVAAHGLRGHGV
jgi:hypothetical protein